MTFEAVCTCHWLTLNVLLISDDHGFSPLHWCCKEGHTKLAELLISRGARINATNRGDDTPLHLASAHGHKDIVQLVYIHLIEYCSQTYIVLRVLIAATQE